MLTSRLRQIELLCAYAEPLASGRRVLVVGVNAAALGEALVELGARSVHAYEAGRGVDAAAAPGVIVKRLPDFGTRDFDVRDGAFDLAIVPNAAELPDAEGVLTRLRRLVGSAGVVMVGAPAAGPLGYYELYDLVSLQFAEIAMVGQVPFTGAALAVLGDERDPEVTVDTQLAGDASPPEYFLAIASQSPLDLRPYVILQLPSPEGDEQAAEDEEEEFEAEAEFEEEPAPREEAPPPTPIATSPAPPQEDEQRERDRAALAEARLRADVLEAQLQDHRARLAAAQEASRQLEQELARRDEQARILVRSAQDAENAARVVQARLDDVERALGTRDEHLSRALARAVELEAFAARAQELEASAVRAEQAQMSAQALEVELIELAEAHAAELAALEEALRERGKAVQELERELVRRERMIKELLLALEHAPHGEAPVSVTAPTVAAPFPSEAGSPAHAQEIERMRQESSRLQANLESLANDAARREGELQAMRWRIDELELQRAAEPPPPTYTPPGPRTPEGDELGRLQDELDALRQALRQEHEARLRAENGDELAKARAEIQRQAVLLEQLGRERSPEGAATG